ncbi:DUF305 domain-containing protein [Saccharopolyspora sp. NPDC050389]|uniref:DUF305 domain-containing protein n=1 Tax=Saccharopolyspora TaxID=1835 RepID=UPI0033D39D27
MIRRLLFALCGLALLAGAALIGAALATPPGSPHESGSDTMPSAVDMGFLQDMIVHHQQAVTMSEIVRSGAGVEIASLADVLRGNQLLEIGQMTGFLQAWDKPLISSSAPMDWMPGHAESHQAHHDGNQHGAMPGMATQDELNRLGELTDSTKEVYFLQLMVRHHQGGVLMADYAATHAATPQVKALAQRIAVEQSMENQQLTAFLGQRDP